jgi:integrase
MGLQLYRRHRPDCKAGRRQDSRNGEFEERRRDWKRCACLIFASGTLAGKFKRQSTGCWTWDEAKNVASRWESEACWPHSRPSPTAPLRAEPDPAGSPPARARISAVVEAYLDACRSRGIKPSTFSKYKTLTKQLLADCTRQGYLYIDQLGVTDMDRFYGSWQDSNKSKAKKLERLKGFVRFCLKRKWLAENIAEDLVAPPNASVPNSKAPFDDQELERIYAACAAIGPPTGPGPGYRTWGGDDVRDFVDLSIYTGLRISDVATFDISRRLQGNDVFLRMHKTGKPLYTWIPDWLVDRLRTRERIHGPEIFLCGETGNAKQLTDIWRNKRLKAVFKLAGPFEEKPTPHRFRHTFARILLEKGIPVGDVAELIGDTEEVVRRYYAKWMPSRQQRLSRILQEAFEDRPRLRVVPIR